MVEKRENDERRLTPLARARFASPFRSPASAQRPPPARPPLGSLAPLLFSIPPSRFTAGHRSHHPTIRFLALLIALATATMDSAANGSNGSAASPAPGVWSAEELMGAGNGSSMLATSAVTTSSQQGSVRKMSKKGVADPMDWGSPGHLTKEEVDVFVSLVLS